MEKDRLDAIKRRKEMFGYTCGQLELLSGVPCEEIGKLLRGEREFPREEAVCALEEILVPERAEGVIYPGHVDERGRLCGIEHVSGVKEEAAYGTFGKEQGEFTADDYFSWPVDERIELIDGRIYKISAPAFVHQVLIGEIHYQIMDFIKKRKGTCIPFMSPVDVQLDCDDKTILQPDLGILCDRDKLKEARVFGAPDMVVEVVSPSSRRKDMTLKLEKYQKAGVREYWIIDPYKKKIVTYFFGEQTEVAVYGFDNQIPVRIYGGELLVDMSVMKESIEEEGWKR